MLHHAHSQTKPYTDENGISYQLSESKPCVIKLHTKNKKTKSERNQVGYLCGFCQRAYFNNEKMKFPHNKHWSKMIHHLSPLHPKFTNDTEERLQQLYKERERVRKDLELKPHIPKERVKLENRIARLEEKIVRTNHITIYSLSGQCPTRNMGV